MTQNLESVKLAEEIWDYLFLNEITLFPEYFTRELNVTAN